MLFETLIKNKRDVLSQLDLEISDTIMQNKALMPDMSIGELANLSFTSKSSILRFSKKLGFKGYTDFKLLVNWTVAEGEEETNQLTPNEIGKRVELVLEKNVEVHKLDTFFATLHQRKSIYLLATSMDQTIQAEHLTKSFLKIGLFMVMIPSNSGSDISSTIVESLNPEDLLIVFSHSGENENLKELLLIPIMNRVPIISFTYTRKNWLEAASKVNFFVDGQDDFDSFFYTSYIHMMIDFLFYDYKRYLKNQLETVE